MMTDPAPVACQLKGDTNMEGSEDSNDEIQRYMHGRGCSKRHTVGCTDDLSKSPGSQCMEAPLAHSPIPSSSAMSQSGGGGRTRRTGLLTVMERPPGKDMTRIINSLTLFSFSGFDSMHELFYRLHFILIFLLICIHNFFLLL